MAQGPVLLSGYAAKRCARRIHNEWDTALEQVEWEVPATLQMRFDAGNEFEAQTLATLRQALPAGAGTDLQEIAGRADRIAATRAAIAAQQPVIIRGELPEDPVAGRTGRPDLLVHVGAGRYVPGEIKSHRMTVRSARAEVSWSQAGEPTAIGLLTGFRLDHAKRLGDYLQLAHYWRMLEAIGVAPESPCGVLIGTDVLGEASPGQFLIWADLAAPLFETYSRSRGRATRTALERYDHEFDFRLLVARNAAAGEPALVQPIFIDECDNCAWFDQCRSDVDPTTPSAAITSGRLEVREWKALAAQGVDTVAALAALDPTDPDFLAGYLPEVSNIRDAESRLATAVRRARMVRDGIALERETTGPVEVPRADVEIDFDIEWDLDDCVYLWGALVTRPDQAPEYLSFASFAAHPDDRVLAEEFATWLRAEIAAATAAGHSLLVYHYATPEPRYLSSLLGRAEVADLLAHFVDLLPIIRANFFGVNGLGIKKVAPAFGFSWRDEDPGGLQSQAWLLDARAATDPVVREEARQRILAYNEDDVRATAAIRDGLS